MTKTLYTEVVKFPKEKQAACSNLNLLFATPKISGYAKIRNLILTLLILISCHFLSIAVPKTASVSGNWSSTATWGGVAVPSASDAVTINSGITVSLTAAATCSSLTNNGTLTANAQTITVAGAWVNNGTFNASTGTVSFSGLTAAINAGTGTANFNIISPALVATTLSINTAMTCSALTFGAGTGANTVNINATTTCGTLTFGAPAGGVGTGGTVNISSGITLNVTGAVTIPRPTNATNSLAVGAGTLNAGSIAFTSGGGTSRHQITISTGTVNVSGNVSQAGSTGSATITFTGAGLLQLGGTFFTAATGTLTTVAGSTVEYNAAAQTVGDFTYDNLTLSGSGSKTLTGVTVNGILSMEGTATASVAPTYGSAATLQYKTASDRTVGVEWLATFAATGGIIIANAGVITMNSAKVLGLSVPLTINTNANLSTSSNNYQLTFGGNFVNNGTFTAGSSPIVIASTAAVQSIDGFTTTGLVSMTKTSGIATLQDNVNGAGLTINGAGGTLNLGTLLTHTFSGVITLTAGTLNGGSSTLNANATSTTAWNGTGSVFSAGTSTVIFGGVAQTLSTTATTFNNLTFSGSGTKSFTTTSTINGAFTVATGVVANLGTGLTHSATTLSMGGTGQPAGSYGGTGSGATFVNTTYFTATTGKLNVGTASCGAPGIWLGGISTDWNTGTNWCGGTVPTSATNVIISSGGNQPVIGNAALCNNLTINTGASLSFSGAFSLTISGTFTNSGTFTPGTLSTVAYNGSAQTVLPAIYNNLTFSGSGTKTLTSVTTVNGVYTIATGIVVDLGSGLTHVANSLTLGGNGQPAGSYGGTGSAATFINTTYFSASTGKLNVGTSSCSAGTWIGGVSTDWNTGANWCSGTVPTAATDVTIFPGGNQPIIGAAALCNNITINTGASLSFSGAFSLTISGTFTNSGTFTPGTLSTVAYNGSAQTVLPATYNNLSLQGSGSKTLTGVTVNGILSMEGTATASVAPTYGSAATLQYKTASDRTVGVEWLATFAATGGIIIANAGVITMNSAKVLGLSVPLTINTNANLSTSSNNYQLTFGGNFVNNGTFTAGSSPIVIASTAAVQSIDGFTT
ncbi:MAG: hypothetical protein WCP08_16185, partial [Prolixibacteraceae bacterium]